MFSDQIQARCEIPPNFYHANRPITDCTFLQSLPNESLLTINICLLGGSKECDVCYEKSEYFCPQYSQHLCDVRVDRQSRRSDHSPEKSHAQSSSQDEALRWRFHLQLERSFVDAEPVAILAEKFNLTSFNPFQSDSTLAGEDTLVQYLCNR